MDTRISATTTGPLPGVIRGLLRESPWLVALLPLYAIVRLYAQYSVHRLFGEGSEPLGSLWMHDAILITHLGGVAVALLTGLVHLRLSLRRRMPTAFHMLRPRYVAATGAASAGAVALSATSARPEDGMVAYLFSAAWWIVFVLTLVPLPATATAHDDAPVGADRS